MLEVISLKTSVLTPKGKPSKAYVICRCGFCGNIKIIYKARLFKGDAKTCGRKECTHRSFLSTCKAKGLYKDGLTSDGYKRVCINRKQFLVHRLIIEKYIGRKLKNNEVVHHLNGIKTDNRIENLEVLTGSVHSKSHAERLIEIALLKKKVESLEKRIERLEQEKIRLIKVS